MRHGFAGGLALCGLLWGAAGLRAHHAVQAAFDQNDHVTLTSILTKVLWIINPHVRWFLDVKDENGKVTTWTISGGGPGGFRDIGISGRDVFKPGGDIHGDCRARERQVPQRVRSDVHPAGWPEDRPLAPVPTPKVTKPAAGAK